MYKGTFKMRTFYFAGFSLRFVIKSVQALLTYVSLQLPHDWEWQGTHWSPLSDNRMQGNGLKLCQGKLRLAVRKEFSTERAVMHSNKFPRGVVMPPSQLVFMEGLDNTLRYMV